MRSPLRRLAVLLVVSASSLAPLHAQSLTVVPDFQLNHLLPGSFVFGFGRVGEDAAGYGPSGAYLLPGDAFEAVQSNTSSTVLAGVGLSGPGGFSEGLRFRVGVGWESLPAFGNWAGPTSGSFATRVAALGDLVTGSAWVDDAGTGELHAYRWPIDGPPTLITDPAVVERSQVHCMSADGAVLGGAMRIDNEALSRAVLWDADDNPSAILPHGWPGPEPLDSSVFVMSSDGSVVAGTVGSGFVATAFVWSAATGPIELPEHPLVPTPYPTGINEDGTLIVGHGLVGAPTWVWTPEQGMRTLPEIAAQLELDANSLGPFQSLTTLSTDGRRMGGRQPGEPGGPASLNSWILEWPEGGVGEWNGLGGALSGSTEPGLQGFGALSEGTPGRLAFNGLTPSSHVGVFFGLSRIDASFKGGTLIPAPDIFKLLPTGSGSLSLPFVWPAGVPSGFSVYVQGWMKSGGGPVGFAATNALEGVTP